MGFIINANLNLKLAALAIKAELKAEKDKITKLQAFHSSLFDSNIPGKVILKMMAIKII